MRKETKKLLCLLLFFVVVLTTVACGGNSGNQDAGDPPAIITDTGAGDSEKQVAALTALNALRGTTEEARLTELATQLPTCPFCGKAATWSAFQYDSNDPNKIAANNMSADANAPSHFYVYGDKTTIAGNWLTAPTKETQHYACILLDGNIASEGSILAFFPAILHVGGRGSVSTSTSGQGGLFAFVGTGMQHELNLYGGTFYSTSRKSTLESAVIYTKDPESVINIWSDDVIIGSDVKAADAQFLNYNVRCGGTLNMYAGTIRNGKAGTSDSHEESANLHLVPGSHFNMYGGTIKGGYARKGANIYICSADWDPEFLDPKNPPNWNAPVKHPLDNAPVVKISGGTIEGGHATSNGGGIFNKSTELTIDGCKLLNNKSTITGGNFWTNETVKISNTLISGGESTHSHGGNIFLSDGDLYLDENTTVENGKAKGRAGNIYVNPNAKLFADGPIIQNTDEIHADLGGNIYVSGGKVYINCLVSGGHAVSGGGNIYVVGNKGLVELGNCEIVGGIDDTNPQGGNISFEAGTLKLVGEAKANGKILLPNNKNVKLVVASEFTGDVTVWRDGSAGKVGGTAKYASCTGKFTGSVKNSNCGSEDSALLMKRSGKSLQYSKLVKLEAE